MPRKGQWVKVGGQIGIWYAGQFHQVNEAGHTVKIRSVDPSACVLVTDVKDIPAPRRAHLPEGYNPHTRQTEERN